MVDSTYPLFPTFAFLGFIASLIPLPWHLQAWNSGTCYFMMWSALSCLNEFVNSVVWAGNVENHSPGWCEISIRIMIASSVGIPASSLCINRRLYKIASAQTLSFGRAEKVRAVIIDTLICVLFPLIIVALHYIVQGHRFNIYEDIGCYPALYNTIVRYFISSMWPIIIGLISATYCILSLRSFSRRRLEFSRFLNSKSSSLTISRYFRLMALAMCDILLTTPLAIFTIWINAKVSPLQPWISWEDTHYEYWHIGQIQASFWKKNEKLVIVMEFTRWVIPFCAFIFLAFFGFADEARKYYSRLFHKVVGRLSQSKKGLLDSSDSATITPMSPVSRKSSYLPTFTPPSYYPKPVPPPLPANPVIDISRPESTSNPFVHDHDTFNETNEQQSPTCTASHTICDQQSPKRFSWNAIPLPFSDRRHTSYF